LSFVEKGLVPVSGRKYETPTRGVSTGTLRKPVEKLLAASQGNRVGTPLES
jgi:hypothetical protein